MNRRGIPNSYGMFGQQSKTQQPVSTTYSEGIVSHYSKIIDELKEEIKSVKDVFEWTIKQKDYYTKSIVDELKKIIEEQNFVISKFRKIIEVSKLLKSSSIKDEQNGIQSNTEGFTIASKREAKLKQKIEEDEEIQQAPFQNNSHQSLNKSQPNFRLANWG